MIRKIKKIIGLVLIATCIASIVPGTPFNEITNAAENEQAQEINIEGQRNSVTLANGDANPTDEQIFYLIKAKLDAMYAQQNCVVLASPTPVKSVLLSINSDIANKMATSIVTNSFIKEQIKNQKMEEFKKKNNTDTVPDAVKNQINTAVDSMTQEQLDAVKPTIIKAVLSKIENVGIKSVPIYGYKAVDKNDMTTVKDQGYFVGGKVGYVIMEKQGKPIVISASALDNTIVGKLISEIKDKFQNLGGKITDLVGEVTGSINDLSDSLDDLTDRLNDKNDDVDDAWDKVFDRFDNDKGWGKKDGYTYYYDKDGVSLKGAQKINGKTYYFNRIDGAMETGWQIVDGKKCYFDKAKRYQLFTQWVQDNEDRYFLGEDGAVKKMQWVNDGGISYYLKADGKMTKDWFKIEDYWYYFNKDGKMATSTWKWSDGKWYYLKDNGQVANDWLQLGTNWYYFKDPIRSFANRVV